MSVPVLISLDDRRRNLVRIASLAAFVSLPTAIYDIYLGLTNRTAYFHLAAGVLLLLFIVSVVIIRTRHIEKPFFGVWHLLSLVSTIFLLSSALQSNVGAEMGLALLIISLVVSIQALPPEQVSRGAVFGAVVSLAASLLVFYSPLPQETDPRIDVVTIWVARGASLAVLALAMTQFRNLNIANKLLIAFLGVVVVISLTFNIVMATTASQITTDQVGQEIKTIANSRSTLIGDFLHGQVEVLQTLALDETIRQSVRSANALKPTSESILALDEQWQQAVASGSNSTFINSRLTNSLSSDLRAFQALSPENIEVFVTDQAGALVAATNVTSDYYQADEDWWISTYQDGEGDVYIEKRPQFDASANALSIIMAVPVYDTRQGDLIGILRTTLSLAQLTNVLDDPVGETGSVNVIFPGNPAIQLKQGEIEQVEPIELNHIAELENSNQNFATAIYNGEDSIFTTAPIGSIRNAPEIDQLEWKAVIHQSQNEALAPVRAQVRITSFLATIMAGIAALLSLAVSQRLARPISSLTEMAGKISAGDLDARAPIESQDELGQLARTFNATAAQLQETLSGLEDRVTERTAELEESSKQLEKRAGQFEAIAQLARTITSIQDMETLLPRITKLVSQRFEFYHTGLFLLDESRKYAVLSAANSEGGQRMLARKHRLAVGQSGIVGYVTATGNPRIALDTGTDAVYFDNPDMPETRSEMALPLRVGGTIIGALDVQSTEANAFSEDDVETLSILADEVSIAIENARLYEESQRVLADAQSAFGEFTQEAWRKLAKTRTVIGYELSGTSIRSLEQPAKRKGSSVAIPIKLRDQVIGTINISLPENKAMDTDEVDITQALAERVGTAIENATLLEDSRLRATRESVIGGISAKLSATAEVGRLMQVAVGELRDALGASQVSFQLSTPAHEQGKNETD